MTTSQQTILPNEKPKNHSTPTNRISDLFAHCKADDLSSLHDIFSSVEDESKFMTTLIMEWVRNVSNETSADFLAYFDAKGWSYDTSIFQVYGCAFRTTESHSVYAVFFNYRATGKYMALIRAKDKYFSHAVKSQNSKRKFVTDSELIHSGKEDNYYLCSLWDIPNPKSQADTEIINNFFQHARAPPLNIGLTFKMASEKASVGIKNLPEYFKFSYNDLKSALRPLPATLFVLQPANTDPTENFTDMLPVDKPIKDHYPTVFAGFSGIGKTVSALMLKPSMIRGDVPDGKEWPIVGIYYKEGKKLVSEYAKDEDSDTEAGGKDIELGRAIANLIAAYCELHIPGAKDLSETVFYVILDEMGDDRDLAALLIGCLDRVIPAIRQKLQRLKFVSADTQKGDCRFHFSIVGTGVTSPGPSGSLPKGYKLWHPQYRVGDLFQQKLTQLSDCGPSLSQVMFNAILTQPGLSTLLTNVRCEALMAESLNKIFPYNEDTSALSSIEKVPYILKDEAETLVSSNATLLEDNVILGFTNVNGWRLLTTAEKVFYAKWVISLNSTQPHGFHLLPLGIVEMLVIKLGIIGDTFIYDSATNNLDSVPLVQGPSHPRGFRPTDTQQNTEGKKAINLRTAFSQEKYFSSGRCDKEGARIRVRFEVPPASFVIAVNIVARITGSGSMLLPKVYEKIVTSMFHATLQTFTWYASYDDGVKTYQPTISVPLRFLLPNAPSILQNEEMQMKATVPPIANASLDMITKTKEWSERCIKDKWEPVKADRLSTGMVSDIVDETWRQIAERGVALVVAGDTTPLSDITLFSVHQCIGIELKNYTEGGLVKLSTLRKRCYQMGYDDLYMTTNVDNRKGNSAIALPSVLYPMLENATRLGDTHDYNAIAHASLTPSVYGSQLMRIMFGTQEADTKASRVGRLFHMIIRYKQSMQLATNKKNQMSVQNADQTTDQKYHHNLREFLILCSPKAHLLPSVTDGLVDARFVSQFVAQEVRDTAWKQEQSVVNGPCLITTATLSVMSMSVRCSPKAIDILDGDNAKTSGQKCYYICSPKANKDNLYERHESQLSCYVYKHQYTEWGYDTNGEIKRIDIYSHNDVNVQFFRTRGATVDMNPPAGCAAHGTVKYGDIITSWNNRKVDGHNLQTVLSKTTEPHQTIKFTVLRKSKRFKKDFQVPQFNINKYLVSSWGDIERLNYDKPMVCIGFEFDDALNVTLIEPYGAAEMAGVQIGDQVAAWGGTFVDNKKKLDSCIKEAEVGRHVLLRVSRGGKLVQLQLRLLTKDERYKDTALYAFRK